MPASVLIVDDDPLMQRLLERALTDRGYAVRVAVDGQQAMQLAEAESPALLITDCFLPKMDGVHLCKFLRADPRFRRLPMILISGTLDPEVLELCKEFGINASFQKGEDTELILAAVDRLLQRPEARPRSGA